MIHPETKLKWVSNEIGYGVFATSLIPKGTAVYVRDALEITVGRNAPLALNPTYSEIIRKYSYIDAKGDYVLSWDHGRFVNHCCFPNTITTGYGFEIAVRDIAPGEEITDDYGLFNLDEDIPLSCDKGNCRGRASSCDFDANVERWDGTIRDALTHFYVVDQPLLGFFEAQALKQLNQYLETGNSYLSVGTQRYVPGTPSQTPANSEYRFKKERKIGAERSE